MSALAYLPSGIRKCESCQQKILWARYGEEALAYDFASHIYWVKQVDAREWSAERLALSLEPGPNGLGPAIPHLRTCVDPRVPALDRGALVRRVEPDSARGPGELLCRCGARIFFGFTRAGVRMPLDVESRIDWIREGEREGMKELVAEAMPFDLGGGRAGLGTAVSHFRTCPKASEFSRGKPFTQTHRPQGAF